MHAIGTFCAFKVAIAARVAMNRLFFSSGVLAVILPTKQMTGLSLIVMTSALVQVGIMLFTFRPYFKHAMAAGRNCMRPDADLNVLILISLIFSSVVVKNRAVSFFMNSKLEVQRRFVGISSGGFIGILPWLHEHPF